MATVFKRVRRQPIPEGAEIIEKRGKRVAVWTSRGRTRRAEVTPDGTAVLIPDDRYSVEWFDWQGQRRRINGGSDKDAAEQLGRKLEIEAMQRRKGLIDPRAEKVAAEGRRPIQHHLDDFRASLEAKGDTPEHVELTVVRATRIIETCGVQRVPDISPSAVAAAVADLRNDRTEEDGTVIAGLSLRTCNGYLRAIKTFSGWLHRDGRAVSDTLGHLPTYNVETDRRRERRVLSAGEFRRLIESAEAGPVVEGVPGKTRAVLYILAAWTGFRRGELASLTRRSFDLESSPATVSVAAAYAKNRRQDTQPLHPAVVQRLREWMAEEGEQDPGAKLFPLRTSGGCWRKTSLMMRSDLERAGLDYMDEDGLFADFHAHRHGFITALGKAGVPLATAQRLARHSDPKLTSNTYTHLGVCDRASAIDLLPDCPISGVDPEANEQLLRATGTDDAQAERTYDTRIGQHPGQQCDGETLQNVANGGKSALALSLVVARPQVLAPSRKNNSQHLLAASVTSEAEGSRTLNHRIDSPAGTCENAEENGASQVCGSTWVSTAAELVASDADLAEVAIAWAGLPATVKASIIDTVRRAVEQ